METAIQPKQDFPSLLEKYKREIARALPKHLSPERMARIALTCFRKTPQLAQCDPKSVFAAVITASQMGLEPGINCHLVPFKRECQLIPDWKGLVDLVHRAGRAAGWTGAGYEGEHVVYGLGDSPFVDHKPLAAQENETQLRFVYAIGRVHGSEWPVVEVWPGPKGIA